MKFVKELTTGLLLIGMAGAASANLITNGGFEDTNETHSGNGFDTLFAPNNAIEGWAVTSGSIDWINTHWQASEGTKSIDLAGNQVGQILGTQFATRIGTVYDVSFDVAGNPDNASSGTTKYGVSSTVNGSGTHNTNLFSFDTVGATRANMGWTTMSYSFTASDFVTSLQFQATSGAAWGVALDNVIVTESASVAEPATLSLFGLGLMGLGFARRSRNNA
jgi:choice-of-anchor C domain-containing protein